jgi:hypothetical protein
MPPVTRHPPQSGGHSDQRQSRSIRCDENPVIILDMSSDAFYGLVGVIIGALLAALLTWIPASLDRKRRIKANWHIIDQDIVLSHGRLSTLAKGDVLSPLYRLPLLGYEISLPALVADSAIGPDQYLVLSDFFLQVQDINRGLDQAASAVSISNDHAIKLESNRNGLKARALLQGREGDPEPLYDQAKRIVQEQLARPWWRY